MGMKLAMRSRSGGEQNNGGGGGGSQMNGGQNYQNNGGGSQMNGAQPMQASPGMNGGPHMNTYGGPQMGGFSSQMNGGAMGMAMSYPVGTVPPGYMPGHPVPSHPQASQMGFLAPLSEMGPEGMFPDYLGEEMRRGRSSRTGRFVHRAEGGDSPQMRGAGGGSGGWGMGHAEADEDEDGEVQRLKKKVKKLTKKLEKLEEELEEKEGEGRRKKKKLRREEDDDEDDEDDPAQKLGCALSGLLSSFPGAAEGVFGVVANPPPTWTEYLRKSDFGGIAKMEFGELMQAVQAKKPLKDLKKELFHTAAALLMVCGKS